MINYWKITNKLLFSQQKPYRAPTMTGQNNHKTLLPYVYDDGGRARYFKAKGVGDCVCRAIAIASGKDYKEVYDALRDAMGESPRNGVKTRSVKYKRFMSGMGFVWTPCSSVGDTTAIHLYAGEMPAAGRLVCHVAGHSVAVIDGVVHDIWDSRYNSFGQPRRVYGYWTYNGAAEQNA